MADEEGLAPDQGFEPEPTQEPEPSPEATPEPEPEAAAAPQPTPDEIIRQAEERAFQRTASWMGRRDKDLMENIGNLIDSRMRTMAPPAPPPPSDPQALLENPDAYLGQLVPRILDQEISRRTQQEQRYMTDLVSNAGKLMQDDPLFNDEEFGKQVAEETSRQFASIDKRMPANVAAELLINRATAAVIRKQRGEKVNPLAGNTPGRAPASITPPVAAAHKVKLPPLSDLTKEFQKKWGYTDDAMAKLYGEAK
jgi:hypothetical protein